MSAASPIAKRDADAFASFHPALCFGFFAFAIILGMCLRHPVYLAIGLACAGLYYGLLRRWRAFRLLKILVPLCLLVTVINPLFNTLGEHVLFTWLGNRPYTLEALYAGASVGAMVAIILLWFGCYNAVMTSEKFLYLFGSLAPRASLILTMALRFVPRYQAKYRDIAVACRGIGCGADRQALGGRLRNSGRELTALSGWALENGIVTSDSMQSRGFGRARRSTYRRYRFGHRDAMLAIVFGVLGVAVLVPLAGGAAAVAYVPALELPSVTVQSLVGYGAYAVFLLIPSAIDLQEAARWRSSLSRI
ncbi:MAG: energy-coupling factor transporter transmembrane component T [Eggerthellaceae bacterium]|jgi:energy-coupling factor transport system permease protein